MRNRLLLLAVALVLAFGATTLRAGSQDFTLVNETGLEITELYISASNVDDWEEDVLGVEVLEDGESVDITFSPKAKAALWDLKIVDGDGDEIVWTKLNLNKISKVTLHYSKDGTPTADLE